ncbi:MAG: hypothetical protein AAF968_05890, partial [Pseudomonadota bacterium]
MLVYGGAGAAPAARSTQSAAVEQATPLRLVGAMASAIVLAAFLAPPASADEAGNKLLDDWDFVVAPYLLLPSIDGTTSIGRVGGDVSVSPGGIFSALQFGGMFHAEARHMSGFGAMFDTAFMFLGDDATGQRGITNVDVDIFQGIFELYGTYRFDFD